MVRSNLIFLAIGGAVLGFIVLSTDLDATWRYMRQIGWAFFIVLALYGLEFIAGTIAWQLTFSSLPTGARTGYRLWRTQMIGETFNLVLAHVGGEAIKAMLLKKRYDVPYTESAAALVLSRTILVLSLILFLSIGLALILYAPDVGEGFRVMAYTGLAVLALVIMLLAAAQRWRGASRAVRFFAGARAEKLVAEIVEFEELLFTFYRTRRRMLVAAFVFALANWVLGVVTLYYTFRFLGVPVSMTDAWIMEALTQFARLASFFIPAHLGAQESALVLAAGALTGNPAAGLAASLVRRGRELVWALWGLALGWSDWRYLKGAIAGRHAAEAK